MPTSSVAVPRTTTSPRSPSGSRRPGTCWDAHWRSAPPAADERDAAAEARESAGPPRRVLALGARRAARAGDRRRRPAVQRRSGSGPPRPGRLRPAPRRRACRTQLPEATLLFRPGDARPRTWADLDRDRRGGWTGPSARPGVRSTPWLHPPGHPGSRRSRHGLPRRCPPGLCPTAADYGQRGPRRDVGGHQMASKDTGGQKRTSKTSEEVDEVAGRGVDRRRRAQGQARPGHRRDAGRDR